MTCKETKKKQAREKKDDKRQRWARQFNDALPYTHTHRTASCVNARNDEYLICHCVECVSFVRSLFFGSFALYIFIHIVKNEKTTICFSAGRLGTIATRDVWWIVHLSYMWLCVVCVWVLASSQCLLRFMRSYFSNVIVVRIAHHRIPCSVRFSFNCLCFACWLYRVFFFGLHCNCNCSRKSDAICISFDI